MQPCTLSFQIPGANSIARGEILDERNILFIYETQNLCGESNVHSTITIIANNRKLRINNTNVSIFMKLLALKPRKVSRLQQALSTSIGWKTKRKVHLFVFRFRNNPSLSLTRSRILASHRPHGVRQEVELAAAISKIAQIGWTARQQSIVPIICTSHKRPLQSLR